MNFIELLRLSIGSLVSNKLRTGLTTLGIIIGVFAVILLVSIGTGLQNYITTQISGLGSNLIFVIPGTTSGRVAGGAVVNKLTVNIARELDQKLKSIAVVGPIIAKTASLKYRSLSSKGVTIYGTTSVYPDIINVKMERGIFFTTGQEQGGNRVAVIGQTVVKNLFPTQNPVGLKMTLDKQKYTVIGVLAARGSVFGQDADNTVVVPITAAQQQFGITNVNAIYVSAKKPEFVPQVKSIANKILLSHLTVDDFTLQTQEQTLSTINSIISVLTIALGGIAAISLLVGGIGVMNIMLVSVTERTREIGLRKAIGARRQDILAQFLLEAVMLSLFGGGVGILLGVGASILVSYFFISVVTPWSVILAFGFSIAVGIIFGIAPALRASKLNPIEALRFE